MHLVIHLGMTGQLTVAPSRTPPEPHTHVVWVLDRGREQLRFRDIRRFGSVTLFGGDAELEEFFTSMGLGPEPFDDAFTGAYLHGLLKTSRAPVKAFLLDQRRVAGVGNIYADEALFRARIHPLRPANRLTRPQAQALRDAVVESLALGIESRGASIDDFRDPDGVAGTFQDRFLVHLREGEPCTRCGTTVRKLRAAGRGTYVCERCQPA